MYVHVDGARWQRDEQGEQGIAPAHEQIAVGSAHGAYQQLVAHGAAIDEQELLGGVRAVECWQSGISRESDPFAFV